MTEKKDNNLSVSNKSNTIYKGKLIRKSCASIVVQTLNKDTLIGENNWELNHNEQPQNDKKNLFLDNVFTVENYCDFPKSISEKQEFYFLIIDSKEVINPDCAVCMMMDYPPQKQINIKVTNRQEK